MTAPAGADVILEVDGVSHWFGSHLVLYDVRLQITRGQVASLVGPSGCGKSTLFRAVVGTHPPREGRILVRGKEVEGPGRDRGIVYQQYSLFPFLTAQENVAFGLKLDRTNFAQRWLRPLWYRAQRKEHLEAAAAWLEKLDLGRSVTSYPHQLSGGMRQRVAIAQALIMKPEILLLDEPFGALDEATREELQDMLLELNQENRRHIARGEEPPYTILIVTHELNEAIYVSERVIGLSQHWAWEQEGHQACPGATIVYDAAAPAFLPNQARDYELLVDQRQEVRDAVFDEQKRPDRAQYLRYWETACGADLAPPKVSEDEHGDERVPAPSPGKRPADSGGAAEESG